MTDVVEEKNARITKTMFGVEDHGILTFWLQVDYGHSGQGIGGYALDGPIHKDGQFVRRQGSAMGMELMARVLNVVGVPYWEELPGKYIRVRATDSKVQAIGNVIKDEWLDFNNFFEEWKRLEDWY
jgi:hypothetical protein